MTDIRDALDAAAGLPASVDSAAVRLRGQQLLTRRRRARAGLALAAVAAVTVGALQLRPGPQRDVLITPATPAPSTPPTPSPAASGLEVTVFFLAPGAVDCTEVVPVTRREPGRSLPEASLRALLRGPSESETRDGLAAPWPSGSESLLQSVSVRAGTAYVSFAPELLMLNNITSSCASSALLATLQRTLVDLDGVGAVLFAVDRDARRFYEGLELSCPDALKGSDCQSDGFA